MNTRTTEGRSPTVADIDIDNLLIHDDEGREEKAVKETTSEEQVDDNDNRALLAVSKLQLEEQHFSTARSLFPSQEKEYTNGNNDKNSTGELFVVAADVDDAENNEDISDAENNEDIFVDCYDGRIQSSESYLATDENVDAPAIHANIDDEPVSNEFDVAKGTSEETTDEKRRDDNTELWDLLEQSKKRLGGRAAVMSANINPNRRNVRPHNLTKSVFNNLPTTATSTTEATTSPLDQDAFLRQIMAKQSAKATATPLCQDDYLREIMEKKSTKSKENQQKPQRNLKEEDAELKALLNQTRKRLEEGGAVASPGNDDDNAEESGGLFSTLASLTSRDSTRDTNISSSSRGVISTISTPPPKKLNPYVDSDLPEEDASCEDRLTPRQLLISMAIAEEAARSGKDCFATETLRPEQLKRDLKTFDFVNKDCQ